MDELFFDELRKLSKILELTSEIEWSNSSDSGIILRVVLNEIARRNKIVENYMREQMENDGS